MCTNLTWPTYYCLRLDLHTTFRILKHTYGIEHTRTHMDSQTHIYTHKLQNTRSLIKIPFLSFNHQLSNVRDSKNPNSNPCYTCKTYARQQTLTLNPTPTKNAQEIAQIQKPIPDSGFRYNIFTDKTHDRTTFKKSIIYSLFLTSHSVIINPDRATC